MNPRAKTAKEEECDEREYSIKVKLPALGVSVYSCTPDRTTEKKAPAGKSAKKEKTVGKAVKAVKAKVTKKKESPVKAEKLTAAAKRREAKQQTKAEEAVQESLSSEQG